MYEEESYKIRKILGIELIAIHHIGSTAVRGLKAKPIIDMMPIVKEVSRIDRLNSEFEKIGYECMGELGMLGRRYFRKGGDNRTHQIHIFGEINQLDIERHLAVRNYLRVHPNIAKEYGELKSKLAVLFPNNIEGYSDGKDAYVKQVEQDALQWYRKDGQ